MRELSRSKNRTEQQLHSSRQTLTPTQERNFMQRQQEDIWYRKVKQERQSDLLLAASAKAATKHRLFETHVPVRPTSVKRVNKHKVTRKVSRLADSELASFQ